MNWTCADIRCRKTESSLLKHKWMRSQPYLNRAGRMTAVSHATIATMQDHCLLEIICPVTATLASFQTSRSKLKERGFAEPEKQVHPEELLDWFSFILRNHVSSRKCIAISQWDLCELVESST